MANEINFGYITGQTLHYYAWSPDGGTARGNQVLTEAQTGYYTNSTPVTLTALDIVIIINETPTPNQVVGFGQYQPEVTAPAVITGIATLQSTLDATRNDLNITSFNYDQRRIKEASDQFLQKLV